MHIYWHGQNCFKIVTKEATIITDPFGKELGIKPPRTGADIVTISGEDYTADNIKNSPLIFDTPGEYEAKRTLIRGLWSHRDNKKGQVRGVNVVFTMEAEGIRICHLGDIGHLLDEKLENKTEDIHRIATNIELISQSMDYMKQGQEELSTKVDNLSNKVDNQIKEIKTDVDSKVGSVNQKVDAIEKQPYDDYKQTTHDIKIKVIVGIVSTLAISAIGFLATLFANGHVKF